MFGILLCKSRPREFSKFARNKLLARTGSDTGITKTETTEKLSNQRTLFTPDVTFGFMLRPSGVGHNRVNVVLIVYFFFLSANRQNNQRRATNLFCHVYTIITTFANVIDNVCHDYYNLTTWFSENINSHFHTGIFIRRFKL